MKNQLPFLSAVVIAGAFPAWASARPHHDRPLAAHRAAPSPVAPRLRPIAFDAPEHGEPSKVRFAPDQIAGDRIPTRAFDRFGRGGVASIGYEPGAARPLVGAHELNAAFSSQPATIGGILGGGVSLYF